MAKTALLLMDLQNAIIGMLGGNTSINEPIKIATKKARAAGMPIIYIVVKFREGFPEVSANNKSFSGLKAAGMPFTEGNPAVEIHETFKPEAGDIVVTKRRVGAFSGSDLDAVLRAQDINHIVLAGLATSGVVLSTVRLAADMDFKITVLSDCCADRDAEVHKVLIEKVFPGQAEVVTAEGWAAS